MRTPLLLLKIIGKAALHAAGVGGMWSILVEDVPELANNVWNEWLAARSPKERKADLEAVALLGDDVVLDVDAILRDIAADQPDSVRKELAAYLTQIPATVRQTLRRPADPTGRTVSPALEPRAAQDLIPFLAAQRPRFKAGDRPIPGSDWVLDELLGIGGYGEVWKARHAHIDDFPPVALKFCIDPTARERLLKHEARICARVIRDGKHPGIVELQQTYLSADPPCLQYEYIGGGTLANVIKDFATRETPPSPEEVARLLLTIARPVAFAHRLDPPIVHRDLKPANILLQGTNGSTRVKITDFGIGGIATAAVIRATRQPNHPGLLLTKAVSGSHSPIYASPEQAAGSDPDPRDDVHALGVIWYQMLTGRLTAGPTAGMGWRKKLAERGMASTLIDILDSCLDDVTERIGDARVLCDQIEAAISPFEASPRPETLRATNGPSSTIQTNPASAPIAKQTPAADIKFERKIGELVRFEGHGGTVWSVAFAPDGRTILSGSEDWTVRLWDVANGREVRCFDGHESGVQGVAFAPNGQSVLSGSNDKTLRLWEISTGNEIRCFKGHQHSVRGVAFSPDGQSAISGSFDRTIRLWEITSGREIKHFDGHNGGVWGVAFAPDNQSVLSGCFDQAVRLWAIANGRETRRFTGHKSGIWGVAFAPDGRSILSGSNDNTVRLWSITTGREIRCFKGHMSGVCGVAFSPDGRFALSGSNDRTVRLWNVATGREIRRFEGHKNSVCSVAFAPDGRFALSGSLDGTVRLWGLPD